MPQYRVELSTINTEDESKDIGFSTLVVADNRQDAISKAKEIQQQERPELHPSKVWAWSSYETSERSS